MSVALYRTAFPDLQITVEDLVAEGDTVVLRWSACSPAGTGEQARLTGLTRSRLAAGKIAESWTCWDRRRVLSRLEQIPPTEARGRSGEASRE
jgi:predicted ester cyclase